MTQAGGNVDMGGNLTVDGTLTSGSDGTINNAFIGEVPTYTATNAQFSHKDRAGAGEYSFLSANDGETFINAKTGKPINFRINNSTKAVISSAGDMGVGTTSPSSSYKMTVNTGAGQTGALTTSGSVYINSGALGVNVAASATAGRIDASNDIVAYQTSDKRLKENIKPIENALDKVKSLTGVEFDWIEETKHVHGYDGHDVGVIAQEVQAVLPEAIRVNDTGYLSVRYEKMIALLVEGIKEQQAQIDELKARLDGAAK